MGFRRRWPGVSYGRGEDWHYVGDTGEPAFENSWVNNSAISANLAFRIRESDILDIQGAVKNGTDNTVFTLPAGYRPSGNVSIPCTIYDSGGTHQAGLLTIDTGGVVKVYREVASVVQTPAGTIAVIYAQVFLVPPTVP